MYAVSIVPFKIYVRIVFAYSDVHIRWWLYHTTVTRWLSPVKQELLTLQGNISSQTLFFFGGGGEDRVSRTLLLYAVFCEALLVIFVLKFDHLNVCPSVLITLWYLHCFSLRNETIIWNVECTFIWKYFSSWMFASLLGNNLFINYSKNVVLEVEEERNPRVGFVLLVVFCIVF